MSDLIILLAQFLGALFAVCLAGMVLAKLHLLPADEMIRSGCIERLFAGENACFDAATRTVRLR